MSRLPVRAGAPGRKGGSGKYAFHAGIAGIWTMTIVGGIRSYLHDGGRVFSEPTFLTAILLALSLAAIGAGSGVLLGCSRDPDPKTSGGVTTGHGTRSCVTALFSSAKPSA